MLDRHLPGRAQRPRRLVRQHVSNRGGSATDTPSCAMKKMISTVFAIVRA
jgi:hypothetical protein